jgi:hypothetical protein
MLAKAKQRIYLLKKSFVCSDDRSLVFAFKTYVLPILEYCSSVWSPSTVTDIVRIESIQRSFTKYLRSCNGLTYNERLLLFGLCSLERRRLIADLILLYKVVNNLVVLNLGQALDPIINSITRGHSRRFKVPLARTNNKLHSFVARIIRVWNCLSEGTVTSTTVLCFKKLVHAENLAKFLVIGF